MATHDSFVALMSRLCIKNGRNVVVRRDAGSVLIDVAKPWLGSTPIVEEYDHKVAFLDNDSRDLLILLPGRPDERTAITREIDRMVIVPRRLPTGGDAPFELDVAHLIVDGAKTWQITHLVKLQPGPTLIGWFGRISV